jgi:hypothetical protein
MIWQVSPGPDLFCRTVVALTRAGSPTESGRALYTRILPQLAPERRPPVSNFGYTCALGPPYRVHRACPIYFLGPSSFRRSAFFFYEAPIRAKNTRILPQLAPERRPPVSNFGYTCALGPPYRVHRACPIYFLGLSSFRRSAFEAPKGTKNAASATRFDIRVRYRGAKRYSGFTSELIYAHLPHNKSAVNKAKPSTN